MTTENEARPQFAPGTSEWFKNLDSRKAENQTAVTELLIERAKVVLGDSYDESVSRMIWERSHKVPGKEKRFFSGASPIITIVNSLQLAGPQFDAIAVNLHVLFARKRLGVRKNSGCGPVTSTKIIDGKVVKTVEPSIEELGEGIKQAGRILSTYANAHEIPTERQHEMNTIAALVYMGAPKVTPYLDILRDKKRTDSNREAAFWEKLGEDYPNPAQAPTHNAVRQLETISKHDKQVLFRR